VAQAVVDKVVRIHHDVYMGGSSGLSVQTRRDDITFLVRNFNFPLPNALASPTLNVRFNPNPLIRTIPADSVGTQSTTETQNSTSTSMSRDTTDEPLQAPKRIRAYVDFSDFYKNVELARREGNLPPGVDWSFLDN